MRRLVIAVGWLTFAAVTNAQSDWSALQQLAAGTVHVRIEAGSRHATGAIHQVSDSGISVKNAYGDVAHFRRQDVQRVERIIRASTSRKRGMLIGFLSGAALSAVATAASGERGDRRRHELPLVYGITMGGGLLVGALLTDSDQTEVIYTR